MSTIYSNSRRKPVPFRQIKLNDQFWKPRIDRVLSATLPDLFLQAEERIDNFAILAGLKRGKIWLGNAADSDVYKIMEGAAMGLVQKDDETMDRRLDEIIELIAAAQEESGYLNTQYMLPRDIQEVPEDPHELFRKGNELKEPWDGKQETAVVKHAARFGAGPDRQWKGTMDEWPKGIGQLYCAGHLFEAAANHYQATGKRKLLDVACRLADHIDTVRESGALAGYADHPQIEIGLMKLYEVTGNEKYAELAHSVTHRGNHSRPVDLGGGSTAKPISEQREAWGHCVRTMYLYSGLTDLIRREADVEAEQAIHSLWRSTVESKMYVTGGIGNGLDKFEQHGDAFVLPNEHAYCECCSAIGLLYWNHRLNLLTGEVKYADLVELSAYNGSLSGISLEGTEYYYQNKLAAPKEHKRRWRYLFCCPAQLPRFITGIAQWQYTQDEQGVTVNLYAQGKAEVELPGGSLALHQKTLYPWDGNVELTVEPSVPMETELRLRLPFWACGRPFPGALYHVYETAKDESGPIVLSVNGERIEVGSDALALGYCTIRRRWQQGDRVSLTLPMPVRRIKADTKIAAAKGRSVLMRGPLIYCLEGVDNQGSVFDLSLGGEFNFRSEFRQDLLNGVAVLKGSGLRNGNETVELTAVPYYAWDNREQSEMLVWLPDELTDDLIEEHHRMTEYSTMKYNHNG